ncbi:MAG: sortase family protein [Frankiales bacterium]|nr:sortase family protein [Frankiales bacterium]
MSVMGDGVRTFLRGIGQTLITLGVVVLLFCVYELEITNIYTGKQQHALAQDLKDAWAAPTPAPSPVRPGTVAPAAPVAVPLGQGLAVLRIPRLGRSYAKVVLEGVGVPDLKRGPGHYPGTALPGAVGNVVVSGHRTTYGAPFADLDRLVPGDAVVLETRDSWFTYRMTGVQIVAPTAIEVTYAVPGNPTATPTQRLLTLTTCNPKYSAKQRLVVRARLESRLAKAPGVVPPALTED